ncbi:hypothetical protein [Flavobacterium sandaracinum]|uniref:Uncharacterized protein n=1 Tax=Flavobacterium sandaracinum TaxID=2541733 RepID=A0A4R5D1G9_9FLAO|nr:hypothetical protein [Flavobacterium sandaracinum]TDE05291.1 hypothetical protein E0F91_07270 [Flavobacterium sandaracinum]
MKKGSFQFQYILAVLYGMGTFYLSSKHGLLITFGAFLVAGGLFGFIWPRESWRWGLWLLGPLFVLMSFSILFAGQLDVFIKKDLPSLMIAAVSAFLGSFIFARVKRHFRKRP